MPPRFPSPDGFIDYGPVRRAPFASEVAQILDLTADAYSKDRYAEWSGVAVALLLAGYSVKQAAAIMLSKLTRWAADASNLESGVPAQALLDYLARNPKLVSRRELAEMVAGTFGQEG